MYRYAENGTKLFNEFKVRDKSGGQVVALTFYDSSETKISNTTGNGTCTLSDDIYDSNVSRSNYYK